MNIIFHYDRDRSIHIKLYFLIEALHFTLNGGMRCWMQKHLRIVQVVNVRWFNATAWYGLSLSRLLKRAGHDVLVAGLSGTESFRAAQEMGLAPISLPLNTANPLRIPPLMRQLGGIVRDFQPHVVNCHRGEGVLFWGLLKKRRCPFALVRTRGDQRAPKDNMPNRVLHARLIDALIATNSRTAGQYRNLFGLGGDSLFTIQGGVDTTRFAPDAAAGAAVREKLGCAPDDLVVGLLGRFDAVKGQKELIAALSCARARLAASSPASVPRIRLLLLGFATSISQSAVEAWLREYDMAQCTVITGRVDDVPAHINALDLGVIASQGSEAIARAAFEIMACGVPLVGTDVGVMPDLLSPRALVPAGNADALSELLANALRNEVFRTALRDEQHSQMRHFSEQAFLERTLAVYETAIRRVSLHCPSISQDTDQCEP